MKKSADLRYLKKILTSVEIENVHHADNPDCTLAALWACKESAFKALKKKFGGLAFRPARFCAQIHPIADGLKEGRVIVPDEKEVFVRVYTADDFVHCIGVDEFSYLDNAVWGVERMSPLSDLAHIDLSMYGRRCLLQNIADNYSLDLADMKIIRKQLRRDLKPPSLYVNGRKSLFDISLSHDGQYVAFAYLDNSKSVQ